MAKIIIANWKMNPQTLEEAKGLFDAEASEALLHTNLETIICPPFVFIEELAKIDSKHLGAQDIFWKEGGAFTGEISTEMLKNFGVTHALVGHSDRRYVIGESDEMINKKVKAALKADITPVLLVGERNHEDDRAEALDQQLSIDLAGLAGDEISKVLIVYEPVWAISTSDNAQADTPEKTLEAIGIIQKIISEKFQLDYGPVLYGGSVNEKNAADFLKHKDIGGAVIGGASLRKNEFINIMKIVSRI